MYTTSRAQPGQCEPNLVTYIMMQVISRLENLHFHQDRLPEVRVDKIPVSAARKDHVDKIGSFAQDRKCFLPFFWDFLAGQSRS